MQTETHSSTKPSRSSQRPSIDRPDAPGGARRSYPRWETFKRRPDYRLVSAGGVVYRNRGGRLEVFFIKDPYGRWSFPKGKIELGETLAQTAVREIREETGLEDLQLVASLGKTSFRFWREAGLIEKTVHLFLFKAPSHAKARLSSKEAIRAVAWMPVQCAFQVSGYRNSDRLLGEAMRKIAETEGLSMPLPMKRQELKLRPGERNRKMRGKIGASGKGRSGQRADASVHPNVVSGEHRERVQKRVVRVRY